MIARTVNNLVPSEQLKQNVFKKYVYNADSETLTIDIDVLPSYI
jgi:hypothetical protein